MEITHVSTNWACFLTTTNLIFHIWGMKTVALTLQSFMKTGNQLFKASNMVSDIENSNILPVYIHTKYWLIKSLAN